LESTVPRHPVICAALVACAAAALPALAQTDHSQHMTPKKAAAAPAQTAGIVKKVDPARGEVTIAHEEIRNLDMPKMTMVFKVRDPAWLKKLKAGDAIRFTADTVRGELTVTSYEATR
jgi:Cu(I)/Ag(I) efflux system protein CusF